jgi:hypothetical protein
MEHKSEAAMQLTFKGTAAAVKSGCWNGKQCHGKWDSVSLNPTCTNNAPNHDCSSRENIAQYTSIKPNQATTMTMLGGQISSQPWSLQHGKSTWQKRCIVSDIYYSMP